MLTEYIGNDQQDKQTDKITDELHQMDAAVTTLAEGDQTSVRVLPRLTAIDIPAVMDIQPRRAATTAAAESVTTQNIIAATAPTLIF